MTLLESCGWTAARASVIAAAVTPMAWLAAETMRGSGRWGRRAMWGMLIGVLVTPGILVGYGYTRFAWSLIHYPWLNEAWYAALVGVRTLPVATLVWLWLPRGESESAVFLRRMGVVGGGAAGRVGGMPPQGLARAIVVGALVWLLGFVEFEMASLFGVSAWPVWLLDAQRDGAGVVELVGRVVWPVGVQLVVISAAVVVAWRGGAMGEEKGVAVRNRLPVAWRGMVLGVVGLMFVLHTLTPGLIVLRGAVKVSAAQWGRLAIFENIAEQLAFAITAAVGAWLIVLAVERAGRLFQKPGATGVSNAGVVLMAVLVLPGLIGPLAIGLVLLAAFQQPGLITVYDTGVPLLVGLVVWLLPAAVVLRVLLRGAGEERALYAAELAEGAGAGRVRRRGRSIRWALRSRVAFWTMALLGLWAYFDVVLSNLLSPVTMNPITSLLYNQMHYGQIASLSGLLAVAIATPIAVLALLWLMREVLMGALRLG